MKRASTTREESRSHSHTHNSEISQYRERERGEHAYRQAGKQRKKRSQHRHTCTDKDRVTDTQMDNRQTHTTVTHQMGGHGWQRLDASDEQSVSQSAVSAQPVTHMHLACDHIHRRTCSSPIKERQRGSQAGRQAHSEFLQYVVH